MSSAITRIVTSLLLQFQQQGRQVVSIIGSGGKTTLLWHLARALAATGAKVLVSTTTKMLPDAALGVTVAGRVNRLTGKLEALPPPDLREHCARYDYVILEADGAAGKPLKAWAAHEPVVPDYTTMTVAVLPLCAGMPLNDGTVHRFPLFSLTTGARNGDVVQSKNLAALIRGGLFYRAYGTKVLYERFYAA